MPGNYSSDARGFVTTRERTDAGFAEAERAAGGVSELARRLGMNKGGVARWGQRGIPAERVLQVERATGVSRQVLRPDIYPKEE